MANTARPGPPRPLTERQERALLIADGFGVTQTAARSMPSLAGRGLAEKYRDAAGGVSHVYWRLTEAGRTEAARVRQERAAAEAEGRARCARGDHDEQTAASRPYVTRVGGRDLAPGTRYCQRCKTILLEPLPAGTGEITQLADRR
jgi:DNA-binding MarR family transcriptional regulator